MSAEPEPRKMALHTKILLGLALGAACGIAANLLGSDMALDAKQPDKLTRVPIFPDLITYVMGPLGQIFLNLLIMTVVPLVFASLAVGVARLGNLRDLGRIGVKTFAFFIASMAIAVTIGLTLVNTIQPGRAMHGDTREELSKLYGGEAKKAEEKRKKTEEETKKGTFDIHTFVEIVPRNPIDSAARMDMLGVIFFALLIGIGLNFIHHERGQQVLGLLEAIGELMVFIIDLAMKLAPYGVFALIYATTARFGFHILESLGLYVFVVLLGLAIHFFGSFSVFVAVLARLNPLVFFRKIRAVIVTAFSTSSSSATLPTSIKVAEQELGVPAPIAGFVLPLGATMNMNGTALYEGVTVVFLAQVFGVHLTLTDQLVVIVLSVLTAVGAAGVPGGSLPLLMMVLATVGVPESGIAIILGVDRILDMCRTTLNVVGDVTCAAFITRSEGLELLKPQEILPAEPPDEPVAEPLLSHGEAGDGAMDDAIMPKDLRRP